MNDYPKRANDSDIIGFMRLTDWELALKSFDSATFYPSFKKLKEQTKNWEEGEVVEVKVSFTKKISDETDSWISIDSAPKDGTTIELTWLGDDGKPQEIWTMQWCHIMKNGLFSNVVGFWATPDGSITWNDADKEGAPTHWRPTTFRENKNPMKVTNKKEHETILSIFRLGAQITREMLARFVEQGGDASTAASIRANWNPNWGEDPGKPDDLSYEELRMCSHGEIYDYDTTVVDS